jgi:signal transduction histidine kinase
MMATHELTTPITAIRGKLSMAIQDNMAHLDKEQKEYFEPAFEATNRLNHLSQQLLSVTRIDQDELVINTDPIVLDDLIKEVLVSYQTEAAVKDDKLIYAPAYKGKPINIDARKIKEVLSNLIDNAIHFTDKGKITIETKMDESGQNVVVSVSDTGLGIETEAKKDLFGKFNQSDRFDPNSAQEQQGAGLGLYIAKNFIELHGGKIWFESEKDKGSTFYFSLPAK